jgi:hypothetical protein
MIRFVKAAPLAAVAIAASTFALGCNGKTLDSNQTQDVSPDGQKATQTQTRTRETPSGTVVKETATRTREVVAPSTAPTDARLRDPAKATE